MKLRTFSVKYANIHSTSRPIYAGVPQGSKIASWLWKAYIQDIPKFLHTMLALYADDTTILSKHKNNRYLHTQLQAHIDLLEHFFTCWRIKVNPNKSHAVYFSKKRIQPPPLLLYGDPIPFCRDVKYLGVILDSQLTWQKHIENVVRKFYKAKNDLAHLLHSKDMSIGNKMLLYKTVLRPILLYSAPVFGQAANCHIQKLQTLQNKTLRNITHAPWYKRNATIHHILNIETIRQAIKNQSQNFYSKIYSIPNPEIFNLPDYDPREKFRRPRASAFISTGLKPE